MKLLRYGPVGREKPGALDAQGRIRDLSAIVDDLTPHWLSRTQLDRLAQVDLTQLPLIDPHVRLSVPIAGIRKFPAIGLNYRDHAKESNLPVPSEPILFFKTTSCIVGPNDDVMLPMDASKADWEVELGVVIGKTVRYVPEAAALDYVAGYVVVNDVSERAFQKERGGQWDKGKGCDTFGPIGPWLVTADEVGDPQDLDLWLDLNGQRMQTGNTRTMIFGVAELIAYCSRFFTLEPGDVLTTGTPPGVGEGIKPEPRFLKPGDVMRLGIEKLGEQRQTVVAFRSQEETAP
jgi:2-keto-4-pentenoate hydratase/2-oxohepta-3-ene-1,7-dioic acid hydratase in catechol pathway